MTYRLPPTLVKFRILSTTSVTSAIICQLSLLKRQISIGHSRSVLTNNNNQKWRIASEWLTIPGLPVPSVSGQRTVAG